VSDVYPNIKYWWRLLGYTLIRYDIVVTRCQLINLVKHLLGLYVWLTKYISISLK